MEWIEPKFSKEKVKRAGKSILTAPIDSDEFDNATGIFHNWRAAHAFPMQIMLDLLRVNSLRVDKTALTVQRLKRVRSILAKLKREKHMCLSRMEDIAGCRVVVTDTEKVFKIYGKLLRSNSKNRIYRTRDYIASPKPSGYRSLHVIYKYNGSKEKFKGLPVELQLRSRIQHSWATAVEVVGAFTNQALKASLGDSRWLDFFKYASIEFAKLEGIFDYTIKDHDSKTSLKELTRELDVEKRLSAFKVAVETLTDAKSKGASYFILRLNMRDRLIRTYRYNKSEIDEATEFYDNQEQRFKDDHSIDLVMVSAESVKELNHPRL